MTNFELAAQVIMLCVQKRYSPRRIAESLADCGLLAEALPAPRIFPNTGEYEWHMTDGYVSLEDGIIHVIHDETDDDWEPAELDPDPGELRFSTTTKGRETAYAILAACDLKDAQDA